MLQRNQLLRVVIVLALLTSVPSLQGQTSDAGAKRAAIQEFLKLIGATQFAKVTFITLVDQYSQALAKNSIQSFQKQSWSPAVRVKMEALTQDFFDRLSKRLREELLVKVGYEERLNRLYLEAYDENFTEAEVNELITFYKSPIGQKFLGFGPKVAISLQKKAQAEVEALMTTATREILDEELKRLEKRAAVEHGTPPAQKN